MGMRWNRNAEPTTDEARPAGRQTRKDAMMTERMTGRGADGPDQRRAVRSDGYLLIDCDACPRRESGCEDCMLQAMLALPDPDWPDGDLPLEVALTDLGLWESTEFAAGVGADGGVAAAAGPSDGLPLDDDERAAVGVFVRAGLVSTVEAARARARPEPGRGVRRRAG